MKFNAVAFDLDGTLYPNFRLFFRLVPFVLKEQRLLRAMDKARKKLRKSGAYEGNFYDMQASLMAEILREPVEKVRERTETLIYRGWEPLFKKIKLFPHVKETLGLFRKEGITMGLLSDFPPQTKLENLGIAEYFDVVLCSEEAGRLKPDTVSFLELAAKMKRPVEDILYVGNSISYDVRGAGNAGMKTALIRGRRAHRGALHRSSGRAPDFTFFDYRQLRDYVLG